MRTRDFSASLVCWPIVCYSLLGSLYPNCQSFGNLEITSPILQIRRSSRHLEGLRLPGTGSIRQAQENSSGHQGPAGRPIARPRLRGSLGPIAGIELLEDHRRPRPLSVTQGYRDPWQAELCYHNPMLAETKTRRRIRSRPPRRTHANPQSSAHLQLPSSCLAGAADPATRRAYGLPGSGRSPQAQERKSGPPGASRTALGLAPAPGVPGTRQRNTAPRWLQTAPPQGKESCGIVENIRQIRNRLRFCKTKDGRAEALPSGLSVLFGAVSLAAEEAEQIGVVQQRTVPGLDGGDLSGPDPGPEGILRHGVALCLGPCHCITDRQDFGHCSFSLS